MERLVNHISVKRFLDTSIRPCAYYIYMFVILQEHILSSNLNICIRQPDGSYSGDSLESPKDLLDEKPEMS